MPGQGLFLVMTDIPAEIEQEFNRWYDGEHIRDLRAFPGVLSVQRYRTVEGQPKYLALYDIENPGVIDRPEYRKVFGRPSSSDIPRRFLNTIQGVYQLLLALPSPEPADVSAARGLLLRGLSVKPGHEREVDEWYDTEHLPNLSRVPGMIRARRYKLSAGASNLMGNPPHYMAVYEMERLAVLESEKFQQGVETPWTRQVRPFFCDPAFRNVYERIFPA